MDHRRTIILSKLDHQADNNTWRRWPQCFLEQIVQSAKHLGYTLTLPPGSQQTKMLDCLQWEVSTSPNTANTPGWHQGTTCWHHFGLSGVDTSVSIWPRMAPHEGPPGLPHHNGVRTRCLAILKPTSWHISTYCTKSSLDQLITQSWVANGSASSAKHEW